MPPGAALKPMPPRSTRHKSRGYTLLEIALVVTIIVLLVGAVVPLSSGFTREQRLRDAVRELLVLAKTARTEAMTTGRAATVIFVKGGFVLQRSAGGETENVRLPRGMTYQIRPFASDKILKPDEQRWIFQPSGLCEPIAVRLMEDDAWMEVRFDALTAGLADESYSVP